jgi:hypothetical protein
VTRQPVVEPVPGLLTRTQYATELARVGNLQIVRVYAMESADGSTEPMEYVELRDIRRPADRVRFPADDAAVVGLVVQHARELV